MAEGVERFEVAGNRETGQPEMVRSPNPLGGGWVRGTDYEKLEQEKVSELEPWEQDEARGIVKRLVEGLRQAAGSRSREPLNVLVAAENLHLAADLLDAQLRQSDPSGEQAEEGDWPAVTMARIGPGRGLYIADGIDLSGTDQEACRYVPATEGQEHGE